MKNFNNLIFPFNTIICAVSIAAIIFTVTILAWKPCVMCLLQQLSVLIIFTVSLLGWIKSNPVSLNNLIRTVIIIAIIFGAYVAADQTYIQYFQTIPTVDSSSCGAITDPFLIQATKSITGSVESCTDITEEISGISLAIYSFVFFICLLVINTVSFFIHLFKKSKD